MTAKWTLGRVSNSTWDDAICDGPICIARVLSTGYPLGIGGGKGLKDEAKARLIAAAPELAEALQATLPALILLGNYIGNDWKGGGGIDAFDRCTIISNIRTVLAAAGVEP